MATSAFDTTCLWPRLDAISCWTDAGSAGFAHRLKSLFPQAAIEPKGLLATEAAITLPWGDAVGAIPALTSTVIEFIDASGCARLAHELQAGEAYRIVLTTAAGLYRYDMGDQVQCVTNARSLPRLLFQGRAGLVSDMVGEKLSDAFVSSAMALLPVAAALAPSRIPKPHYELWLDSPQTPAVWSQIVEAALCVNPQYAYARRIGQLDPLDARALPGFPAKQALQRARSGQRLGDVKPVSLLLAAEPSF